MPAALPSGVTDRATISFIQHRREAKAEFMLCRPDTDLLALAAALHVQWDLAPPQFLLRAVGWANDPDLPVGSVLNVTHGVIKAATTGEGWVLTRGLDAGVMSAFGNTLARSAEAVPLIGVASTATVQGIDQVIARTEGSSKCEYVQTSPDRDLNTQSLEANHTHFLLVDGEPQAAKAGAAADRPRPKPARKWSRHPPAAASPRAAGAARGLDDFTVEVEAALAAEHGCARVLLVCGGDADDRALRDTLAAARAHCVAVLLEDGAGDARPFRAAGGGPGRLSDALMRYVRTGRVPDEWAEHAAAFAELRELNRREAGADEFAGAWPLLIGVGAGDADAVSDAVLQAVIRQAASDAARLRALVAWRDLTAIERLLSRMPAWKAERSNALYAVLQLSLDSSFERGVEAALLHGARPEDVDLMKLFDALFDSARCRYPLFAPRPAEEWPSAQAARRGISTRSRSRTRMASRISEPGGDGEGEAATAALLHGGGGGGGGGGGRGGGGHGGGHGGAAANRKSSLATALSRRTLSREATALRADGLAARFDPHYPAAACYPNEVWDLMRVVVPGLQLYWRHKADKAQKHAGGGGHGEHGQCKPRALDLYVWAVLLGNTPLALVLASFCAEPIRATLLGARLCSFMAERLPLDAGELLGAARQYEAYAEAIIDLCPTREAAKLMLTTRSRMWHRPVIGFALQSQLKVFCANRYCQNLCDTLYLGVQHDAHLDEAPVATLRRDALGTALLPALIPLPARLRALWLVYRPGATQRWSDLYFVPHIKQNLRLLSSSLYVALYSYTIVIGGDYASVLDTYQLDEVLELDIGALSSLAAGALRPRDERAAPPPSPHVAHARGLAHPRYDRFMALLLVWTVSIVLDEWFKYDYISLALTLCAFALRGLVSEEAGHVALSLCVVLGWVRLLRFLEINHGMGVLVIMVKAMVRDIVEWLLVSLIFLGGFTVAFVAIAHAPASDEQGVEALPAWAMLGGFDQNEMGWVAEGVAGKVARPLLWVYVMVSNVLLVNLLIAMMGDTFGTIKEQADLEWKFNRLSAGIEFVERIHPLPPPLNLPLLLVNLGRWCCGHQWEVEGEDASGSGRPDEWDEGGRLWRAKRKKDLIARAVLRERRAALESEAAESVEARLAKLEAAVTRLADRHRHALAAEVSNASRGPGSPAEAQPPGAYEYEA